MPIPEIRPAAIAIRLLDMSVSAAALVLLAPLFGLVALGIRTSSPGPVFYRARRVGLNGKEFVMYKFRTMRASNDGPAITAQQDSRVVPFGALLRRLKIDELPQFVNILRGEMAIVGPRPEDPRIVLDSYANEDLETLTVLPGLVSPGTIYYHTHGERMLGDETDPTRLYAQLVLPTKLMLDRVYVRRVGLLYNLRLVSRAAWVILLKSFGKRHFGDPPELLRHG